ncbi:MAG: sigma-54-dependent Fis family transcriptional regulator [Acidobacteria bacterium]|nr:sigma-54-dependent Fis family transcriptional regulator [Acidobacteriota bacterium]
MSPDVPALVGDSAATRKLRGEIAGAARTHAKILIVGETGVGKEVVARRIHDQSARRSAPFLAVNCSGIAETLLESELFGHTRGSFTGADRDTAGLLRQANHGTLFLDELGEMSTRMQAILLRFTETGEIQQVGADRPAGRVDVRLITATNRDLPAMIAAGAFRQDLYYRLNVIHICVPPLRDRGDDIMPLVRYYLERASAAHRLPVPGVSPDTAQLLVAYAWPGNVREIKNITERLVLREPRGPLTPDDLPAEIRDTACAGTRPAPATGEAALVAARGSNRRALTVMDAALTERALDAVAALWDRMAAGEGFWDVVYAAFKARELTRTELAAIIDRGLQSTAGSYTALLKVFNLPPSDYKRFHAFLYQQECNLPVALYRRRKPGRARSGSGAARRVA